MDLVEYDFDSWVNLAITNNFISKLNATKFLACFSFHLFKIVAAMHEKHIVHRDITNSNIFVSKGKIVLGMLKLEITCNFFLGDFGLSTMHGSKSKYIFFPEELPGHCAPEMTGKDQHVKMDSWSIGLLLANLVFLILRIDWPNRETCFLRKNGGKPPKDIIEIVQTMLDQASKKTTGSEDNGLWSLIFEIIENLFVLEIAKRETCATVYV
jgi:serine/threonine protein kinase